MATNGLVTNNLQSRPASNVLGTSAKPHGQSAHQRVPLGSRVPSSTLRQTLAASNGAPISSVVSNLPQSIARGGSADAEEVDDISLPDELVSLSKLVKQLAEETSKSSDTDVVKLKQAFGELAEDLKQKIAETSAIPAPAAGTSTSFAPVTIRGYKNTAKRSVRVNPVITNGANVESDLEGLIPSKTGVLPSNEDKQVVDRDMVVEMRSRLNKKLSEANTYNRYLLREIQYREDALKDSKAQLLAVANELQTLVKEAERYGKASSMQVKPVGSLPQRLVERLHDLQDGLKKQLDGIESMRLKDVPLVWYGMAEDVKVMGSFDGWTYGEQMSPETTGAYTRFVSVLKLRPGRYEIKFFVDGEWRVAPEWPTVGHGMLENNVLVVE